MKIVIEADYPKVNEALDFVKTITGSADRVLALTPEGTVQTINFDNGNDNIYIKISNE